MADYKLLLELYALILKPCVLNQLVDASSCLIGSQVAGLIHFSGVVVCILQVSFCRNTNYPSRRATDPPAMPNLVVTLFLETA